MTKNCVIIKIDILIILILFYLQIFIIRMIKSFETNIQINSILYNNANNFILLKF